MNSSLQGANRQRQIADLLHYVGVPPHIKGYQYLRESIDMAIDTHELIGNMSKCIYPAVSIKFNTQPKLVERCIRHAIELTWSRGDINTLEQLFGYTISKNKGKPTNGEFIAMLSHYVKQKNK